jgi:CheY-like chemotaxis protein
MRTDGPPARVGLLHPPWLKRPAFSSSRSSLRHLLEAEAYEVIESGDGAEALAKLRAGARPSLILLDLMMPGMNGWQFMDEVRVYLDLRKVPIIVVSAYGSGDGVRSVGATDYLRKPFDVETLLGMVRRHTRPGPSTDHYRKSGSGSV